MRLFVGQEDNLRVFLLHYLSGVPGCDGGYFSLRSLLMKLSMRSMASESSASL